MLGTIIMLHTLQLMSADKQQEINQAYNEGKVQAKESKSGIKYLIMEMTLVETDIIDTSIPDVGDVELLEDI